jgi:8-oxo-dGTP pyrophosphatase MutT (NUDIX family)
MSDRDFEPLGGETIYEGHIFTVRKERFRFLEDGVVVQRDVIRHPGAVGVIAHDDEHVWLVLQPREAIGDPDVLEIPAGRLDKDGEDPLASAQRELAEEIGKAASDWEPLGSFFSSVGILDEEIHLFLATGLSDRSADSGEQERIEIVRWPLDDLDGALAATKDSKTLIALTRLRDRLRAA